MNSGFTLDQVIERHLSGDVPGAEQGYRVLISEKVEHPVLYLNLGAICLDTGRTAEAIDLLNVSLGLNPHDARVYVNLAKAAAMQQRYEDAIAACQKALELDPHYLEPYLTLGISYSSLGGMNEAIASLEKAIELDPKYASAHFVLGNIMLDERQSAQAISCYRRAIECNPNYVEAYLNLGNACGDNFEEAANCYKKAVEIKPDYADGHNNLGNALMSMGKFDDAAFAFRRALEIKPNYADAHNNLGVLYQAKRNVDEAIRCYRKAIELNPDDRQVHIHMAHTLREQGREDEAISCYRKVIELSAAGLEINSSLKELCELLLEFHRIPIIYKDAEEIDKCRGHLVSCLNETLSLVSRQSSKFTPDERAILRDILFCINNFYPAYQQRNDKEFQISYSSLCTRILSPEIEKFLAPVKPVHSRSKIRLGISSNHLMNHNGAFWAYLWLKQLPKEDYEFFLYLVNGSPDEVTQLFAELGTYRWLRFESNNYLNALDTIKKDNLDVLLLPAVGMSVESRITSLTRLAPVQCVSWGHPVTTGSPNIDYYLSFELMETEESDSHYSEQLVRLPNVGLYLEQPRRPAETLGREDFGIPSNRIAYGSVQSLFKYLPQFDFVYPAIAKQVPDAFFIFVGTHALHVTAAFRERLKNEFERAGLSFEKHVKILPQLTFQVWMRLLCVLDVNLDSIGWSGGISTFNSLSMDCPVVTVPGEFMRGRHTYSMLKMIGVEELIAGSLDEYISLAARLGADKSYRSSIVERIKAQKHRLFKDKTCTDYLDKFFKAKVAEARANTSFEVEEQTLAVANSYESFTTTS